MVNSYRLNIGLTKQAIEDTKTKFKKLQTRDFQAEKLKSGLIKEEALFKQRLDLLSSTVARSGGYCGLLASIAGLLPQDLWINRLIMNDNEIQVSGSTINSQLIADFMNKLDGCKDFRNTRFVSTEKQVIDSHVIYNFQIVTEPGWNQKKSPLGAAKKAKE
ncbi:MAG: PilN domain-containing protein [Candidatus Omnitrophota bacterium]